MSSSSGSEPTPQLDLAQIEQAEEIVKQRLPKGEAAQGEREGGGTRRWVTALWAAPGFAWVGFYLIAPLVFIVLVSFWTYEVGETAGAMAAGNSAPCEIVFVEFLGDLVKLHLTSGGERLLAKVPGERYPEFRGREGETVLISWKEEDVQLLDS